MKTPKRTDSHRTDTLAVRHVMGELPPDWLIRSLEERDYGVDLQVEVFDGEEPTGRIAHIQVKGTDKKFEGDLKFPGFPVKTITYAERFVAPFFVFYTSTSDKKTYFVWLQKYLATKLDLECQGWRAQETVTITFPEINRLSTNFKKIDEILKKQQLREQGVGFLAAYEWLRIHMDHILMGNTDAVQPALHNLKALSFFDDFIECYGELLNDLEVDGMMEVLGEIACNVAINEEQKEFLEQQMGDLLLLKMTFLDQDEMDSFAVEVCDIDGHPY